MAFSAVAVLVCHNFEYFDFCVDVLDQYSFSRNASVFGFLLPGESTALRFLFRRFAVLVDSGDSLVSAVQLCLYALKNTPANAVFV